VKKIFQRIWPIFAIILSALVIVLCIGGIVGIWILEEPVSSATVQILHAVEISAQTLRDGIASVDATIVKLEKPIIVLEASSELLSHIIEDKGLLLTILPTTKEQELTTAAQSVQEKLASTYDFMDSIKEMVQAVNALPFIDLQADGLASVKTLRGQIDGMMTFVGDLKTGIGEIRSQASDNISKITEAAADLSNLLAELRSDLAIVDTELTGIQDQAIRLQELMPKIILSSAIVMTLLMLWIGYTQIVMIDRVINRPQTSSGSKEINKPDIPVETKSRAKKTRAKTGAEPAAKNPETAANKPKETKAKVKKTPAKTGAKPADKKPAAAPKKPAARKTSTAKKTETK